MTDERRAALGVLGLSILVAASWWSCGADKTDGSAATTGGGGTGGSSGSATTGGSKTGGTGGVGGAGGTKDAGAPCVWEGWFHPPRMPPDCEGLCIPDDPEQRLPHLAWVDHDEFCTGCKWLDTTAWMPADAGPLKQPVGGGVFGVGPGIAMFGFALYFPDGSPAATYYDEAQTPIAAWRGTGASCGFQSGVRFSHAGLVAQNFYADLGQDQHFVMRPVAKLAELMTATDTTLIWPATFLGITAPDTLDFSLDVVAGGFMGRAAIGKIKTGETLWVDKLPGAQPGEYSRPQVVGDVVIVSRFLGYAAGRTEWLIVRDAKVEPYLGAADKDIDDLVTDGKVVIWNEGTNPSYNDFGIQVFSTYDLYVSPFDADPAKLAPKLLLGKVSRGLSWLQLENGYLSGVYYRNGDPLDQTDALVVRVSDGWAARSQLPAPYSWGPATFTAPSELWGGLEEGATGKGWTIIRYPYSAMQVLQTAAPTGGG